MAAMAAVRWNPDSQACYNRLTRRGKPHKVALVAVMRKLAGLLDTLLRKDRLRQPEAPVRLQWHCLVPSQQTTGGIFVIHCLCITYRNLKKSAESA